MKKYIISLSLILSVVCLYGQVEIFENSVVLDSYHAPYQSYHVRANKSIEMAAGFSFDASYYGNDFLAEIELKELAVAEESSLEGGPEDLGYLVGTDGVAGAIPGSFNVSPSGAATYTIPIECPPGINGMTPQVALTYNSQAGNGIAGWGWNIAGTSAITRVPKNQYYDGIVKAIQWNQNDVFAYNGVRMFEIDDGDSNNATKEYRLENDPTIKIAAFGCTSYGPYWFKVYTGDGKIYYYGDTENSQMFDRWDLLYDHTSEHTLSWNLSKVEDPFGNYIDYLYEYDEIDSDYSVYYYGNFRLSEINYTGTAIDEPFYTVNFGYGNRSDVITNYISTKKFVNAKKLFEISTIYNSTELISYLMYYSSVETYMVLGGITKYGLDEEKYNKTVFEYGESSSEATAIKVADHNSLLELEALIPGDFNGDGTVDFCVQSSNDLGGGFNELRLEIYLREKSGSTYSTNRVGPGSFYIGTYAPEYYGIPLSLPNFMSGDANGNGITDILLYGYDNGYLVWNIRELQYNGTWQMVPLFSEDNTTNIQPTHDYYISLAEFNGDGILDVVVVNKTLCTTNQGNLEHTFYFEISDGTNGHNSYSCDIGLSTGKIKDIYITDNNGDGLSDIIMMDDYSNSKVALSTGNLNQIFDYPLKNCNIEKNTIKGSGDFNIDGLLDLVLKEDDTDLTLAINLGTGSYQKFSHSVAWDDESDEEDDRVFVTDLDDDGIPDVLVSDELYDHRILFPDEYESTTWKEFISRGADFFNHNSSNNITNTNKSNSVTYGDFYADGKDDKFEYIIGDDDYMIGNHYYSNNNYKQLLGKVTNSIGSELDITYQPLNEDAGIYTPGTHTYPLRSYSNSYFPVVSQVVQNEQTMNYLYTDAILNMLGKGFLGYTKIASENSTQNIQSVVETTLETNFYTPELVTSKTYYNDTELLSESKQTFDVDLISGKRYLLKSTSQYSKDYKSLFIDSVYYEEHNTYGSPTRIIKKSWRNNGSILDLTDSTELDIDNITTGKWFIGQVKKEDNSKIRGSETITIEKDNYYNSSTGAPYLKYIHKGETNEVKKYFGYDIFGNIITSTISAVNDALILPSSNRIKTTTNTYSTNGRFLESTTNPKGFETTYVFDNISGLLLSKTDEDNNLTESYEYDGFGRKQKTINVDGTEILSTLHWVEGHEDAPDDAVVFALNQSSGMADSYLFSDKYGRELRRVSTNFTGEKVYSDKEYNTKGQLWKEYLPYPSSEEATYYTEHKYDNYGRKEQVDYPDEKFENFYYSTNMTRVKAGKGTEYLYNYSYINSLGEVIQTKDSQYKSVYTNYYANGLPKNYDYGNSHTVELEYDINGNRTKISDPNTGDIISTYNAWGELLDQTDARGNKTEYKYDILSRTIEEKQSSSTSVENTKTYTYDPTQFTGVIEAVSQTDRNSEITYDYDGYGRITKETELYYTNDAETESMTIVFEIEYDELGRMSKRIYPSGFEVDYEYNDYGDLKSMQALGKTLWNCEDVNNLGQVTEYTMSNKATQIGYNNYGELQSMNLSDEIGLTFSFNDFGNMYSRGLPTRYLEEHFIYDDMNRLTSAESSIHGYDFNEVSITYDSDGFGNMTSKSDVGDFSYGETIDGHEAGPHALTRINNLVNYLPPSQYISYTTFNKVDTIKETLANDDEIILDLTYGVDDQRRQSVFTNSGDANATRTKYFFGDYEEIVEGGTTTVYNYVHAPTGLCAIYEAEKTTGNNDILWHINTDHLGSITYMFSEGDSASSTKEYSFTAWGVSRDPDDWSELATESLYANRGFTGHEHLPDFNLINMNGRVYDPVTARFLSPDPYVQMPTARSGFNRYGYCLNNPLIYTDPSGEIIFSVLSAIFCPVLLPVAFSTDIGWMSGGARAQAQGETFLYGAWRGAVGGAVGGVLSGYGGGTFVSNVAWGLGEGALTGGLDAVLWGNDLKKSMLNGAAIGGTLAFAQSTSESFKNLKDYNLFGTNDGVFNRMANNAFTENIATSTFNIDPTKAQDALDFWQDRKGGPKLTFMAHRDKGITDPWGRIGIGRAAFVGGHRTVRRQISHEMGHYIKNVNWDNGIVGGTVSDPKFINMSPRYDGDNIYGYYSSIRNSGKYHTGYKAVSKNVYFRPNSIGWSIENKGGLQNQAWDWYNWRKWFYLLPRRY